MRYTPVLATLGYVVSPDGQQVLLIHRNRRPHDPHFGKYNGLGGKVDRDEDVVTALRREIEEEAGLECERLVLRGTISWPGFGKDGEDWFGFLFRIDAWRGTPRLENHEGTLQWIADRHFLPLVFERTERQFHGVMPYRDGRPLSWSYSLV
jgi:8-oxo-dGTP diphosphatase